VAEDEVRRQKKIWRLMTHWSEQGLGHSPPSLYLYLSPTEQREAQEREMRTVYETFNGNALDTALAITEHEALEAPAKVGSSEEEGTKEEQEQIVIQVRRRLSMRGASKEVDSKALQHRLDMHGRAPQHRLGMPVGTEEPQLPAATQSRAVTQHELVSARICVSTNLCQHE
jgi:hypothetical protein